MTKNDNGLSRPSLPPTLLLHIDAKMTAQVSTSTSSVGAFAVARLALSRTVVKCLEAELEVLEVLHTTAAGEGAVSTSSVGNCAFHVSG